MEVEHYCLVDNTTLTLYYSSNDELEFDDLKGSNEKEKPILKRNTIFLLVLQRKCSNSLKMSMYLN